MASGGGATGGGTVSLTNPCVGYDGMRMLIEAAGHMRQKAMREDPAAFGIGSNSIDTESKEEEVQDDGVANDTHTGVMPPVKSNTAALTFAEKWMEFQRKDADKHADLRVKLVEMTYKLESLTERLQRSEARGIEMETRFQNSENLRLCMELRQREIEASHAKVVEDFTQKLQDSERVHLELKEKTRVAMGDLTQKMKDAILRNMELLAECKAMQAEITDLDPTQAASEATDAPLMTAGTMELDDDPKQQPSHEQATLKIQEFVDACLEKCPDHFIYTKDLKRMFTQFCDCAVSDRAFVQVLKELGAETKHTRAGNGVVGFKPK